MKVLLVSSSYHPVLGGLQTVTRCVASGLDAGGHAVRVVTNRYPRSLPEHEVVDGVPVDRWLFMNSAASTLTSFRPDLALAAAYYNRSGTDHFRQVIEEFQPDVINLHFPEPRHAPLLQAWRDTGIPLVVSLHGDDVERWWWEGATPPKRDWDVVRQILLNAGQITACSNYLLQRAGTLEPSILDKSVVIHNGVNADRFKDGTPHQHERKYLFAYGRLTYKKGFDLLLYAFAQVCQVVKNVDLILAGSGEEGEFLKRLRDRLNLQENVRFFGQANAKEVVALLNGCSAVVIPSRQEPYGIVAVEALLCGRQTVATCVGGLPELVNTAGPPHTGRVEWADPAVASLRDAILRVLTNPQEPVTERGPVAGLTLKDMVGRYEGVLARTAASRQSSQPKELCTAV